MRVKIYAIKTWRGDAQSSPGVHSHLYVIILHRTLLCIYFHYYDEFANRTPHTMMLAALNACHVIESFFFDGQSTRFHFQRCFNNGLTSIKLESRGIFLTRDKHKDIHKKKFKHWHVYQSNQIFVLLAKYPFGCHE